MKLAAAYRLVVMFDGTTDHTHISARVPRTRDQFLIDPFGMYFEEITRSSLVRIDTQGRTLRESPHLAILPGS